MSEFININGIQKEHFYSFIEVELLVFKMVCQFNCITDVSFVGSLDIIVQHFGNKKRNWSWNADLFIIF